MNTNASVHETIADLEARLGSSRAAAATSVRLLKLITQVMDHWKQDETLEETAALTDSELLTKFAISGAVTSSLDTREHRKLARRAAARVEFLANLKDFGGIFKAKKVGELLGVSRQTVNNHIVAGKLIAIKEGNDYLIPGFQFSETGKLEHLEKVLQLLLEASAEAKCTFFLNPIELAKGVQACPYELMKNGCSEEELFFILREAELFLTATAS
jgi:hypothetical protein